MVNQAVTDYPYVFLFVFPASYLPFIFYGVAFWTPVLPRSLLYVFLALSSPSAFGHFANLLYVRESEGVGVGFATTSSPSFHAGLSPAWTGVFMLVAAIVYIALGKYW